MTIVAVVKMASDQVVCMITVGYRFMTTILVVLMGFLVAPAVMLRSALCWILSRDLQPMLIYMIFVDTVKMAIMKIVSMTGMFDSDVAASLTMFV